MNAVPIVIGTLLILALAYRYYGVFLATKVLVLNDSKTTPAYTLRDGTNYHPTNKWVLFGHHFAAISGAGPLIGPVLAAQYGYAPGLMWLLMGSVIAGSVHDFTILVASIRRGGKSLAEIARHRGKPYRRRDRLDRHSDNHHNCSRRTRHRCGQRACRKLLGHFHDRHDNPDGPPYRALDV